MIAGGQDSIPAGLSSGCSVGPVVPLTQPDLGYRLASDTTTFGTQDLTVPLNDEIMKDSQRLHGMLHEAGPVGDSLTLLVGSGGAGTNPHDRAQRVILCVIPQTIR